MDNTKGSFLMVAAMACFAVEDMFLKSATQQVPVGLALILFGLMGGVIFAGMGRVRGEDLIHPQWRSKPMLWRAFFEIGGRLFFTLAIAFAPLSTVSAVLQATPLFVSFAAIFLFGEKVGPKRWIAMLIGFAGVLLILRPGPEGLELTALFALLGTIGFAGRDLATRASPATMTNAQLGVSGFTMLVIAGVIALTFSGGLVMPTPLTLAKILAAAVIGVIAYSALTGAMRSGEVSVVSPFRYSRLIFAMLIGMIVFGENPDAWTIAGSVLIVLSGLYTVIRSRKR
ncbi:DMT family transporter [Thalassobius sp. I31.1]|uniref:DMT family transporter n=1 Tax=Thalassobius sp. I31.1 TaxID=2109912 RepID=UPI000D1BB954|nr:DMT family transporter [Thalassobius sp. I31.1]